MKGKNKIFLSLIIIFGISYSMAGLFYLLGGEYLSIKETLLAIAYMFVPALSAFFVQKVVCHEEIIKSSLISFRFNRWFLIAWFLPVIIVIITIGISVLMPGKTFSTGMEGFFVRYEKVLSPDQLEQLHNELNSLPVPPVLLILIQGLIAGITINSVAGFGEELGWRGFLVHSFKKEKFWNAAIVIGFIWGIWHAPLILMGHNYPQHPVAWVFMMIIWRMLLSPLFLYMTIKAKSVIAALIMYGTINAIGALILILVKGGNVLTVGLTGFAGLVALMLIIVDIVVYDTIVRREKIMLGMVGEWMSAFPGKLNTQKDGKE